MLGLILFVLLALITYPVFLHLHFASGLFTLLSFCMAFFSASSISGWLVAPWLAGHRHFPLFLSLLSQV